MKGHIFKYLCKKSENSFRCLEKSPLSTAPLVYILKQQFVYGTFLTTKVSVEKNSQIYITFSKRFQFQKIQVLNNNQVPGKLNFPNLITHYLEFRLRNEHQIFKPSV